MYIFGICCCGIFYVNDVWFIIFCSIFFLSIYRGNILKESEMDIEDEG